MTERILRLKPEEVAKFFAEGEIGVVNTTPSVPPAVGKTDVVNAPATPPVLPPKESQLSEDPMIERAKNLLGKDFLGIEAVRNMESKLKGVGVNVQFVLDNLPSFPYTEEDLQAAKASGEMLVLRPEDMIRDGIKQPVTLNQFRELFQEDPLGKMQSIFKKDDDEYKKDWYRTQYFTTDPGGIKLGWSLVKKEVMVNSVNKSWVDQQQLLKGYETFLIVGGAKHFSIRRRTAAEEVYDTLLYYVNTGERLLSNISDWGETLTDSYGRGVILSFGTDGLALYSDEREKSHPYVGVCPTRPVETVMADDKCSIEEAQQIFGKDFLGAKQVEKTFGVKLDWNDIPGIPFSQLELQRAKELDQFLILRVREAPSKQPLTMQIMEQLLHNRFKDEKKGRILRNTDFFRKLFDGEWNIENKDFFRIDTPRVGWALVSKGAIPGCGYKTDLQQAEVLADYLMDSLPSYELRRRFLPVISEFNVQKEVIGRICDMQEYYMSVADLKINQVTRPTPVEALYDLLVYFQNTGQRLLEKAYIWTSEREHNGAIIVIGDYQPNGIRLTTYGLLYNAEVMFSRRF